MTMPAYQFIMNRIPGADNSQATDQGEQFTR